MQIERKLLILAFYSIPFTGVLKLSEKLSLPILTFSIFFIYNCLTKPINYNRVILLFGSITLTLPILINSSDARSIVYYVSFFTCCIIFISGGRMINLNMSKKDFINHLKKLVLISNVFIIYEFVTRSFFPQYFIDFPFRIDGIKEYEPIVNKLFYRSRGFAEESGHMGLFYEFAIPLILFAQKKVRWNFREVVSTILAVLFIFSPFTIIFLLITLIIKFIRNKKFYILSILFVSLLFKYLFDYLMLIYYTLLPKVTFSSSSGSASDRVLRLNCFFKNFHEFIFGVGPMKISQYCGHYKETFLNLYLDITASFGPILLIVIFSLLSVGLINQFKSKNYGPLISTIIVCAHYLIISNFWYPFLFFLIGYNLNEKKQNFLSGK